MSETSWTLGGAIPWFSVSLSITADDLDPGEVTRLLGLAPDEARRRGARDARGLLPPCGAWSIRLRSDQIPDCDLEAAIAALLDRVPESAAWDLAMAQAKGKVLVGLRLDTFNRGFGLSSEVMARLGRFGLCLDVDIYQG